MIGDDLQSCRKALTSSSHDNLHLLERINVDLRVQNSIVPTAYNLARFKISGHLPALQVNFSDSKYKSIMRLVDVAIPHFDDGAEPQLLRTAPSKEKSNAFILTAGLFGKVESGYHFDDTDHDEGDNPPDSNSGQGQDEFYETQPGDEVGVSFCDFDCC